MPAFAGRRAETPAPLLGFLLAERSNPAAGAWDFWIASPTARNDGVDGPCSTASMCQSVVALNRPHREEPPMNEVSTIGLDLAKQVFQVECRDASGRTVISRQLRR